MTEMGAVELWNPPALGSPEVAATEQRAKEVFMNILNRVTLQGLPIASDRKGQNWAPRIFAEEAEAKSAGIGEKMLDYAMSQLIREGKVTAVDKGSGGRTVHKIVPKAATT
jgi:hypothetical protein